MKHLLASLLILSFAPVARAQGDDELILCREKKRELCVFSQIVLINLQHICRSGLRCLLLHHKILFGL